MLRKTSVETFKRSKCIVFLLLKFLKQLTFNYFFFILIELQFKFSLEGRIVAVIVKPRGNHAEDLKLKPTLDILTKCEKGSQSVGPEIN